VKIPSSIPLRIYLGLVIFSLLGSAFSSAFKLNATWIARPTTILTIAMACLAVTHLFTRAFGPQKTLLVAAGVFSVGAASEVVGLYTRFPFGYYQYTADWWPTVLLPQDKYFPLLLPFAWLMMASAGYFAALRITSGWKAVTLGALLASLVDLVMEPVMVHRLGYWVWPEGGPLPGGVPLMNFVGWFVTCFVAGAIWKANGSEDICTGWDGAWVLVGHLALVAGMAIFGPVGS
jgi:uncharacterized membrane protein